MSDPAVTAHAPSAPDRIERTVRDAGMLAHRYDPTYDAVHFLSVPRALHREVTFLTDDYLPSALEPLVVRRGDAMAARPEKAPIHFIFHSAYCCSTLLARAMDRPGWAMGLKEPPILNDLVGWRRRGGQGPDMASVLDDVLSLLARPFSDGEAVVVKPSNVANCLAAPMLTLRPDARALLLHAPLPTYLASIAKKGLDGRLWVRTLLTGLLDDRLVDLGFSPRDHLGQTDLQVAAVGWLAQHALFAGLVERFGAERVRTLDSATLTARPGEVLAALGRLFGRPLDPAEVAGMVAGPAFTSHSKLGTEFGSEAREAENRAAADLYRDEVDKVVAWAEAVAANAGLSMIPPAPLIGTAATAGDGQ